MDRDLKHVQIAFYAYQRFHQLTNLKGREKTYEHMCDSTLYNSFVQFGIWMVDNQPINPNAYIDYLIKNQVVIKYWGSNITYEQYIKQLILSESPGDALIRSVEWVIKWCEAKELKCGDFFTHININVFASAVKEGHISPWFVFLSDGCDQVLNKLDDSHYKMLGDILNTKLWQLKIKKHSDDIRDYKQILEKLNY